MPPGGRGAVSCCFARVFALWRAIFAVAGGRWQVAKVAQRTVRVHIGGRIHTHIVFTIYSPPATITQNTAYKTTTYAGYGCQWQARAGAPPCPPATNRRKNTRAGRVFCGSGPRASSRIAALGPVPKPPLWPACALWCPMRKLRGTQIQNWPPVAPRPVHSTGRRRASQSAHCGCQWPPKVAPPRRHLHSRRW